jgi:hypothetical protein
MTQSLNVDTDELVARYQELVAGIPDPPMVRLLPPCGLPLDQQVVAVLDRENFNLRTYLGRAKKERQLLADSLKAAIKAYCKVDLDAAEAINNEHRSVSAATFEATDGDRDAMMLGDAAGIGVPTGLVDEYSDLLTRCLQVETGDHGAALLNFAAAWRGYGETLRNAGKLFRPFENWEGEAAEAAQGLFEKHKSWLYSIAKDCDTMAGQAEDVVSAHKWLLTQHVIYQQNVKKGHIVPWNKSYVTSVDIKELQDDIVTKASDGYNPQRWDILACLQDNSADVIADYKKKVTLTEVAPSSPPSTGGGIPLPTPGPSPFPDDGGGIPDLPKAPEMPNLPKGEPKMPEDALTGALGAPDPSKGMSKGKGIGGVKAASFGGGGLAPMPEADAMSAKAGAGPGAGGMGRGIPGAMGGGGMGGAPMSPAGQGKGDGAKGKRVQGDEDESLYTEERAWTEGVIGRRRANAPDKSTWPGS